MIDLSKKIDKIPFNVLQHNGVTKESLLELQNKENQALNLCGGLLGNCYIIVEIIAWLLNPNNEIMKRIKSKSWYKYEIKKHINSAIIELHKTLNQLKTNNPTDKDFLEDTADAMYLLLKDDLSRLHFDIIHTCQNKVSDPESIADLYMIDILFQWTIVKYNDIISHMNTIYCPQSIPDFYDSWYGHAKNEKAANHWRKAISLYDIKYINTDIDLNKSGYILKTFEIINDKMFSSEISKEVRKQAAEFTKEDTSIQAFEKAKQYFNLAATAV